MKNALLVFVLFLATGCIALGQSEPPAKRAPERNSRPHELKPNSKAPQKTAPAQRAPGRQQAEGTQPRPARRPHTGANPADTLGTTSIHSEVMDEPVDSLEILPNQAEAASTDTIPAYEAPSEMPANQKASPGRQMKPATDRVQPPPPPEKPRRTREAPGRPGQRPARESEPPRRGEGQRGQY